MHEIRKHLMRKDPPLDLGLSLPPFFLINQTESSPVATLSLCLHADYTNPNSKSELPDTYNTMNSEFYYYVIDVKNWVLVYKKLVGNVLKESKLCPSLKTNVNIPNGILALAHSIPTYNTLFHDMKAPSPFGLLTSLHLFSMVPEIGHMEARRKHRMRVSTLMREYLSTRGVFVKNRFLTKGAFKKKDDPPLEYPIEGQVYYFARPTEKENVKSLLSLFEFDLVTEGETIQDGNTKSSISLPKSDSKKKKTFIFNTVTLGFTWNIPFQPLSTEQSFYSPIQEVSVQFYHVTDQFSYIDDPLYFAVAIPATSTQNMDHVEQLEDKKENAKRIPVAIYIHPKQGKKVPFTMEFLRSVYSKLQSTFKRDITLTMPAFEMNKRIQYDRTDFPHLSPEDSTLSLHYKNEDLEKLSIFQDVKACVHEKGAGATTLRNTNIPSSRSENSKGKIHAFDSTFYFNIFDAKHGLPVFSFEVNQVLKNSDACSKY